MYVLIIILSFYGYNRSTSAIGNPEFNDLPSCVNARDWARAQDNSVRAECFVKKN